MKRESEKLMESSGNYRGRKNLSDWDGEEKHTKVVTKVIIQKTEFEIH